MPAPKILIVDGYNVIHKIPELKNGLASGGLENARRQLALLLSRWNHSHPGIQCTVVFDGDQQFSGGRDQRLAGIPCVFTQKRHGADAEIIRMVRAHAGDKSEITVVSDDNSIRNSCRAHGAAIQPSNFLLSSPLRLSPSKAAPQSPAAAQKGLNPKSAAAINAELKKKFGIE